MKKYSLIFTLAAIIASCSLLMLSCGDVAGLGGYSGTFTYSWKTPNYLPTEDGYYEGVQTITITNGDITSALSTLKIKHVDSEYYGVSLLTVMTVSKSGKSGKGIYENVTSAKMYELTTNLSGIGDSVPTVTEIPDNLYAESSIVWSGSNIQEMTAWQGASVVAKQSYDHNASGQRTAHRNYDTEDEYYRYAVYHRSYDATFNMPNEMWNFRRIETQTDIPAGYDYALDPDETIEHFFDTESGMVDHYYTYYADGQGRIEKVRQEIRTCATECEYYPQALMVYSYEGASEGKFTMTRYEDWNEDSEGDQPGDYDVQALEITFDLPTEAGFNLEDMMFEPWQRMLLPFITQNEYLPIQIEL
jgi:hypothetical protein